MKKHISQIIKWLCKPKSEKLLIIALPCIALIISALILTPTIAVYKANRAAAMEALREKNALTSADITEHPYISDIYLNAVSTGEDMFITVCDADGNAIEGVRFQLTLISPNNEEILCATYTDGSCYLVDLAPGKYTVSMPPQDGCAVPDSIVCIVPSLTHNAPSVDKLSTGLNNVSGKLYFQTSTGEISSSIGIDVSTFNRYIDWEELRDAGIDFAILRIGGRGWGSGHIYTDRRFQEFYSAAQDAGLQIGVYFYSTATNVTEAVAEAEYVLSVLHGAPLDMPVYLDIEYSGDYPNGRADRLCKAVRTEIINAFSSTIRHSGYKSGVYSGAYYITHELDLRSLSQNSLWIANYTQNSALPDVGYSYDIWQYTESGSIRGIFGTVDVNVIF